MDQKDIILIKIKKVSVKDIDFTKKEFKTVLDILDDVEGIGMLSPNSIKGINMKKEGITTRNRNNIRLDHNYFYNVLIIRFFKKGEYFKILYKEKAVGIIGHENGYIMIFINKDYRGLGIGKVSIDLLFKEVERSKFHYQYIKSNQASGRIVDEKYVYKRTEFNNVITLKLNKKLA